MGVNYLWSILSPVRESVPLYSLTGKILAVDLSLWICEAHHVHAMMGKVTKPHLRNLFFRASSLLRMGIKLIFVMEGEAPKIKTETIRRRTEMAFHGKSTTKPATARNTDRGCFKAVLRECAEMLDYLGIPWVAAAGEAEAMCAFLDAQGLVDGCITSDGDAFLYGAQTVYRNFNMNTKDPQIECYKMFRVETELQLKRESLVGLAILLGCDYMPKGVPGVGKEQALKLIKSLNGQTLLEKFSEWKETSVETLEVFVKKVSHCLVCRHPGSARSHERSGCVYCSSTKFCQPLDYNSQCPCDWHCNEHIRQTSSVETNIKKKALACAMFPFTEIISEFLVPKDKDVASYRRRMPNLLLMQNFALDNMEWPKHYTSEKVLVLMTYAELVNRIQGNQLRTHMQPTRICKRRIRNGISCFEVMWKKPDHYVFPENCPPEEPDVVRTLEEENLFASAFPDIVHIFYKETTETKNDKLKKKKLKAEKENPVYPPGDVSDLFAQMSLTRSSHVELPVPLSTRAVLKSEDGQCSVTSHATNIPKQCSEIGDDSDSLLFKLIHRPEAPTSPSSTTTHIQVQNSPSVCSVIEELQLSNIDWDAMSFAASPSTNLQHSEPYPKTVNKTNKETKMELSVPQVGLSSFSVRDGVILSDVINSPPEEISKARVERIGSVPKDLDYTSCKSLVGNLAVPLHSQCEKSESTEIGPIVPGSQDKTNNIAQQPKEPLSLLVPCKYKSVKPNHSVRPPINPEQTNKENMYKINISLSQGSCSEDNCPQIKQIRSKFKALKPQSEIPQAVLPQYIEQDKSNMLTSKEQPVCIYRHLASDLIHLESHTVGTSNTQGCITKRAGNDDVIDNDGASDASADSPRPLAERLKQKFQLKLNFFADVENVDLIK